MATHEAIEPPSQEQDHEVHRDLNRKRRHSPKIWLLFVLAALAAAVLIFFVGYQPRHKREEKIDAEAQQKATEKPQVSVQIIRRAPATSELMVPGTTLAYTEAYIYARASGYLSRRLVDIGDRVHRGQLLAVIDAPDLDKQVAQARSTLAQSQSNLAQMQAQLHLNDLTWARYKVLVAKGVLSRQEGDQQEANFRVAEANVRVAENNIQANRDNLERLTVLQQYERVTAPFDGVITARNVDEGALISGQGSGLGESSAPAVGGTTQAGAQGNNQGTGGTVSSSASPSTGGSQGGQMFTEARIDLLRVLVSVPESYSAAIRIGGRADLLFGQLANLRFVGRVTRTSASIDQNTRTLLVEVQVANPGGKLLPGMYVVANFVNVQAGRPLLAPGEAIVVRDAKQTVALVQDNKIHFVPVTLGRDYGDQTEVLGGLHDGDVIVPTVTDEIQEGIAVDPQYPKAQQKNASTGGQSDKQPAGSGQYGNQGLDNSAQKTQAGGGKGNGKSSQGGGNSAKSGKQ